MALVVVKDGHCALIIGGHALGKSLSGVILTVHEVFACDIIFALDLGRVEF